MANVIIAYDVSARQQEVKSELLRLGYMDRWNANGRTYYLPNTTLWKMDTTPDQGSADLNAVATSARVVLERAIAVPASPWAGIEGQPHR